MASDWLGANAGNIASGWHAPPQLQGRDLSGIVAATLRERLLREQQQGEAIANAIRNVRAERQSNEYLEAAKQAGLIPQDYEAGGVGGATLGIGLAKMILAKQQEERQQEEAESLAKYRGVLGDVAQQRTQMAQDWAATAQDEPETYTDPQGVTWRRTKSGWTPMPTGLQSTDVRGQSEQQQLQEENKLLQRKGDLEALSEAEKQANIKALKPDVHFSREDEYNRMVRRLKEIQSGRTQPQAGGGTPTPGVRQSDVDQANQALGITPSPIPYDQTIPSGSPQPSISPAAPPADQAGGHAKDYGVSVAQLRQQAEDQLKAAGYPVTPANIEALVKRMMGR